MESRIKMLENEINGLVLDKTALESHIRDVTNEYHQLANKTFPKYLKTWNDISSKQR